ncbi:MAG TPA: DUF2510 domain-containing protein [Aldersonia sp.]
MLKALVYLTVWGTVLTLLAGVVVVVGGAALVVGLVAGTVAVVRTVRQRRTDAALAAERAEQELAHRAEAEDARFRGGDMRGIFGQFPPVDDAGQNVYQSVDATPVPVRRDPSIDAAIARSSTPSGSRKQTRGLEQHLHAGEQVTALAMGLYDAKAGVLVLTDRRLIYLAKGAVVVDVSLGRVTDADWRPKMWFGFLTVCHGGSETVFDCQKADGEPIADQLRARIRRTPSTTVATRPSRPAGPVRKRTPPPPAVAPGWYPDHPGAPMQRYWDGDGWTDHTAPLPQ